MNRITALLVSCALLAAPMVAHASGPGGATTDPDVLGAGDEDDEGVLGSLGGGGALIAVVIAGALAAGLGGSDSGSH